jgi:hypothetical protein
VFPAVLQIWQFSIGLEVATKTLPSMFKGEGWLDPETSNSDLRGSRGIFLTGVTFSFLALMNFWNTMATLLEKSRRKWGRVKQSQKAEKLK